MHLPCMALHKFRLAIKKSGGNIGFLPVYWPWNCQKAKFSNRYSKFVKSHTSLPFKWMYLLWIFWFNGFVCTLQNRNNAFHLVICIIFILTISLEITKLVFEAVLNSVGIPTIFNGLPTNHSRILENSHWNSNEI